MISTINYAHIVISRRGDYHVPMNDFNILALVLATTGQFIVGFVWYGPIFGKLWGQMHGFDKLSEKVQKEMMAKMGPWYALQLAVTLVTTIVLALLIPVVATYTAYELAALLWIGFVVPTQVSGVVFGGTESQWMFKKIAVQAGASLACLLVAVAVLTAF